MPKKSNKTDQENISLAEGGVASVDKALTILRLFTPVHPELTLIEISAATGLYKSSILRMLASLENAGLVIKKMDGKYILGPSVATLNSAYQANVSLETIAMPILKALMEATNESAAFHVRHGEDRLCLLRVDSNQALRDHIKPGDLLPLDKGAGGKVLMAFEGATGKLFAQIRTEMVLAISGDRVKEIAGISAPVFNSQGLMGVITLTMPTYRLQEKQKKIVRESAKKMTELLGGTFKQ
ncbi:IclR family transcriptional regulator [Polynucleobacter sinensis]|uniref:IclR family transcriptional regulator n=1 Tax=Polynucleobacter sinensis TaxID=1743157 RepID=UPI000785FDE1|nr:IclR family transcriptional regulator [Polynucleobacter sinensis]